MTPQERKKWERESFENLEEAKRRRVWTNELLKELGYKPYKREDRRSRPLRTKRSWVSCRARCRELEIVRLRCCDGLSYREIGERLGISHTAARKRYEWAMQTADESEKHRAAFIEGVLEEFNRRDSNAEAAQKRASSI